MINMEPNKNGLTPDDLLFIAIAVSLMWIAGVVTWLEWVKKDFEVQQTSVPPVVVIAQIN